VFDLIATVLAWFYNLVPNYAVAIAMMTILIMLLLTPLTLKSTKSMLELQRIQPEMKRLQQEYKGDRQAMNEALMALYKEHKVNPLGGCLPLLIQAPIWIVMYRVFIGLTRINPETGNFDPKYLDHSTLLYQNLSQTNDMNAFGLNLATPAAKALQESFVTAIPYLILVAVVVMTYFVQQRQITSRNKNNPTVNDSPAAAQQQMIMKIFPIFSGVFAFIVPAALAWYFLVQNLFRIAQQAYITKRFYREHPDAIAAGQTGSPKAGQNGKGQSTSKGAASGKGAAKPPPKGNPKATPKPKPTPTTASGNGTQREAPKPPPRSSGSTPKPPARPRPQQKKKP
jgi:YidC/Oxa1 family membrane protein insertase